MIKLGKTSKRLVIATIALIVALGSIYLSAQMSPKEGGDLEDFLLYSKESFWGPCHSPEEGCFENVYLYNSGKLIVEKKSSIVKDGLEKSQMSQIRDKIKRSGIVQKKCETQSVLDYWATYTINLNGQKRVFEYPCFEDKMEEIDGLIIIN